MNLPRLFLLACLAAPAAFAQQDAAPSPPPASVPPAHPAESAVAGGAVSASQASLPPTIRGEVIAGHLLTHKPPVYPAAAREFHISGTVQLNAVIGKDGMIKKVTVIAGPYQLRQAAVDAVSDWTYSPYTLNGLPTEVNTHIDINFNSEPSTNKGRASAAPLTPRIDIPKPAVALVIDQATSAKNRLTARMPVYPAEARSKHLEGTVVMDAVIGANGYIEWLKAMSGPEDFRDSALNAAKGWTYKPYVIDGSPVAVETQITIKYHVSRD